MHQKTSLGISLAHIAVRAFEFQTEWLPLVPKTVKVWMVSPHQANGFNTKGSFYCKCVCLNLAMLYKQDNNDIIKTTCQHVFDQMQ